MTMAMPGLRTSESVPARHRARAPISTQPPMSRAWVWTFLQAPPRATDALERKYQMK